MISKKKSRMTCEVLSSNDACPSDERKKPSNCKMQCSMRRIMIKEGMYQGFYKPDRGITSTIENNGVLAIMILLLNLLRLRGLLKSLSHKTFQVR